MPTESTVSTESTPIETPTETVTEQVETSEVVEQLEEAKGDIENAKTPSEKKAAERRLEKFQLKLDGKTKELELDLFDKESLTNYLQKAEMFNMKAQESAEMRKSVEQFIEILRKDPRKILSHPDIGVDLKAFAQAIINEEIAESQKTPEQKDRERLEQELQEMKDKYENEKKTKETEEFARVQREHEERYTNDIISALDESKLPKSPRAIRYMAEYMSLALENGIEVSAKDVAPLVKQKMVEEYRELLTNGPEELLSEFISPDVELRLQKRRIAKMKKPIETPSSIKSTENTKKPEELKKKRTIQSFLNE